MNTGTLSQKAVALMIRAFEEVCTKRHAYSSLGRIIPENEMYRGLFEAGLERQVLETCRYQYKWNFDLILPRLLDGLFFYELRLSATNFALSRTVIQEQGVLDEDAVRGRDTLLRLAEYLNSVLPGINETEMRAELISRLSADGYTLRGGQFLFTDSSLLHQPQQVSLLKEKLTEASLPNIRLILHHYDEGEEQYAGQKWKAAIDEWRSFLEQLIRDIAAVAAEQRRDVTPKLGPMRDVLTYLLEVAFLDAAEQAAVGSAWGFLSSGSHPGIKLEHVARLAMTQALTTGQVLVLKFLDWRQNGFKGFSAH